MQIVGHDDLDLLGRRHTMTLFIGGPYHNQNLGYDPYIAKRIRLPSPDADMPEDSTTTAQSIWPHLYEADTTHSPPVYRYVDD